MSYRVGYVVKRFPRTSETFIAQEILELESQGADVTVLTLWRNDHEAEHAWLGDLAAPVVHCGDLPLSRAWKWLHRRGGEGSERALTEAFGHPDRRGRHRLREAAAVAEASLRLGLDHLHAHFANDPAFVAYLAHLTSGIPFSFTAHAKDIYAKPLPATTLRRLVGAAAFAVTVSEHNRQRLAATLGPALASKVLRLYNGVDLATIRASAQRDRTGRDLRIVSIARLVEKKGIDTLLHALALMRRAGSTPRCTVVGDGPLRDELEELARSEGLDESVRWLGSVPHERAIAELGRHDVLALPARIAGDGDRDALPTVLLEAMAAELPCVSTPVGGIPEIVEHRRTGLLVPSDRPLALAEALGELERRYGRRVAMGRAARRRAEHLFDRRTNVARLNAWFAASSRGESALASPELRVVEG